MPLIFKRSLHVECKANSGQLVTICSSVGTINMLKWGSPMQWNDALADSWRMARNSPDGKWVGPISGRRTARVDTRKHKHVSFEEPEEWQVMSFA